MRSRSLQLKGLSALVMAFLLGVVLVSSNACAMGSKRPDWTTNEEMKPQELVYWPCLQEELPGETVLKGKFCSPFCAKSRADGSCAVEKKIRVLDVLSESDWEFIRANDLLLGPTKYVFE